MSHKVQVGVFGTLTVIMALVATLMVATGAWPVAIFVGLLGLVAGIRTWGAKTGRAST